MPALGPVSRACLTASAFAAFACAFAGAPLTASSRAEPAVPGAPPAADTTHGADAIVLPRRDPFAGGAHLARTAMSPPPPASALPVPAVYPAIPAALGPLPPNAGAGDPFPFAADRVRLQALVTGPQPFALVDDAGTVRIVTPGDELAGDTIAAITAAGIRLAHGRTIAIAPAAAPFRSVQGGRSR